MKIDVNFLEGDEEQIDVVVYYTPGIDKETGLITDVTPPKPVEQSEEKKNRNFRPLAIIFACIFAVIFVIGVAFVMMWYLDNSRVDELQGDFPEVEEVEGGELVNPPENQSDDYWDFTKMSLINVNFDELLARNPDTVGWINIPSTNINYPVVQATNNEYYLTHAFDKSRNNAGWIFADYRNNMVDFDKNTIIYGHSRVDGTMFGTLKNSLSTSWYNNKNNHVIRMSTPTENTMWQVFSVYQTSIDFNYLITQFQSDDLYEQYLNEVKGRSTHNFDATPTNQDKIITISTCANNWEDERIVLHARLIKEQTR